MRSESVSRIKNLEEGWRIEVGGRWEYIKWIEDGGVRPCGSIQSLLALNVDRNMKGTGTQQRIKRQNPKKR